MVFSAYNFIFYFLPLVLVIYYGMTWAGHAWGISRQRLSLARNSFLLCASYIFYGWWNPWYVLLMFAITLVNYFCGWWMSRPGAGPRVRLWTATAGVVFSLGTLGFFKYYVFFQTNFNSLLTTLGTTGMDVLQIALPMGISFYTFQALSYTIDVYRGTAPPARSPMDFGCYIALYPQLVAGPIIRYNTVADQLVQRSHTWDKFSSGAVLFILGFAKKVLLADTLGLVADSAFEAQSLTTIDAWFGVVAYAFQIYFDFSGYSDMAVGLGRMIGFQFMKNFDSPYQAESITDFWRRWHISLSTFLRDYLYLPLGGNRRGARRTYLNLAIVMLLGGLWHGANWTFVAWGAYHGALLAFERILGKRSPYHILPHPLRVSLTFVLVLFSWVLFRVPTLDDAAMYFQVMFGGSVLDASSMLLSAQLYSPGALMTMALGALLILGPVQAHHWSENITWPKALLVQPLFCVALLVMFARSFSPFLYFQF